MMHYTRVLAGITGFVDEELVSKTRGSINSWLLGAAVGLMSSRAKDFVHKLAENPLAQSLGIVQGEEIDVDAIYGELIKQAQKGSATINIPLIGAVTFGPGDVDSLYRHIQQGG